MAEIDSIIQKYLQGKTSEEDNKQLYQWIQQSPENKRRLFAEKDIWESYEFHGNPKKYDAAYELEQLTTLLNQGDQSVLNKNNNQLIVRKVYPTNLSFWIDGRYEFQNKDLIEVFKVIERWYDVNITADEIYFKGIHFSGVIKRNKDAKHFLELHNHSIPIKYKRDLDKVEIKHKWKNQN